MELEFAALSQDAGLAGGGYQIDLVSLTRAFQGVDGVRAIGGFDTLGNGRADGGIDIVVYKNDVNSGRVGTVSLLGSGLEGTREISYSTEVHEMVFLSPSFHSALSAGEVTVMATLRISDNVLPAK